MVVAKEETTRQLCSYGRATEPPAKSQEDRDGHREANRHGADADPRQRRMRVLLRSEENDQGGQRPESAGSGRRVRSCRQPLRRLKSSTYVVSDVAVNASAASRPTTILGGGDGHREDRDVCPNGADRVQEGVGTPLN